MSWQAATLRCGSLSTEIEASSSACRTAAPNAVFSQSRGGETTLSAQLENLGESVTQ